MNSENKFLQICLLSFGSCLEFTCLQESLLNLLSIHFDEIKKKLESETDIIKFIYFNRNWFHNILYER